MANAESAKDTEDARDVQSEIRRLRAQLDALIERAAPHISHAARAAGDAAHQQTEAFAGQIRSQPITAVLIAAAVGYVFGRLTR